MTGFPQVLGIISAVLSALEKDGIVYCHFKSNEHLDAALAGQTDLDILFDADQESRIVHILQDAGFFLASPIAIKRYPDILDYIGIDPHTGRIVHIHAHFHLLTGTSGVKQYLLPWDRTYLSCRCYDEDGHIWVANPAMELTLLLIRAASNLVSINPLAGILRRSRYKPSKDALREFEWLRGRVTATELAEAWRELLGDAASSAVAEIYELGLDTQKLMRLRESIDPYLKQHRRFGAAKVSYLRLKAKFYRILRKFHLGVYPTLRTVTAPAPVVVILGADGVGKSTQSTMVTRELHKKLDVERVYLGAGKGSVSLLRRPLVLVRALFRRSSSKKANPGNDEQGASRKRGRARKIFDFLWGVTVALEKKKWLGQIRAYSERGIIVICDRYPQVSVGGMGDGPLLQEYLVHRNPFLRRIAAYEQAIYRGFEEFPPQLAIKLLADPEVIKLRRPEMDATRIRLKQKIVEDMKFPAETRTVVIDGLDSIDLIFSKIMNEISAAIRKFPRLDSK